MKDVSAEELIDKLVGAVAIQQHDHLPAKTLADYGVQATEAKAELLRRLSAPVQPGPRPQCPKCGSDPDFKLLQCGSCGVIRGWAAFFPVAEPAAPSAPCITAWPCYSYDHDIHTCKLGDDHIGDHVCKCGATRSQPIQENPAAPQPVAGEGPHKGFCLYCNCGKRVFFDESLNADSWRHFDGGSVACSQNKADFHWQCPTCASEGTPKLEETRKTPTAQELWNQIEVGDDAGEVEILEKALAILRPFITPACSPPDEKFAKLFTAIEEAITCRKGVPDGACHVCTGRLADEYDKLFPDVCGRVCEKLATPVSTGEAQCERCERNAADNEALALISELVMGYREGSTKDIVDRVEYLVTLEPEMSTGEANGQCEYCWHFIELKDGTWLDGRGEDHCPEPGETKHKPTSVPQAEPPREGKA